MDAPEYELLSPEIQNDPLPVLSWYQQHEPVFMAADFPAYVVTRYEDVLGMRDQDVFSTRLIRDIRGPIDGPNVMQLDKAEHKRSRTLVGVGFRPRVIQPFVEATVAKLVNDLLGELEGKGACDLVSAFCEKVPLRSVALLIGLELDDEERLADLYRDQIAFTPLEASEENLARSLRAREGLTELLTPAVARARAVRDDSFLSTVVHATTGDGDHLDEEEIFGLLRFLLPAGLETTKGSLSNVVYQVLARPEVVRQVRSDTECLRRGIEEALRFHPPIPLVNRVTIREVDIAGTRIPEGAVVLGALNIANRDPDVFDEPDRFDIDRSPNEHLSFGIGVHTCLGAPLARATLRCALPILFERLPNLRLAPGFEPRFHGVFDNQLTSLPLEWN